MADDLRVEYVRPVTALGGIFVDQLAARQVIVLAHTLRQPAVHQEGASTPQFLAPLPVLGLELENLLQAARC